MTETESVCETTEVEVKLIETPDNYTGKKELIKDILNDVKKRKTQHYKQFGKYKKINTFTKSLVNGLNAVSVCSMVLTFMPSNPAVIIIALCATSISAITSAVHSSTDVEGKLYSHNTSYLQYTDLYRDISARLLRNNLTSEDLDNLLSEINARMGLVEDHSEPITTK